MKIKLIFAVFVMSYVLTWSVLAAENCKNPETQVAMNFCSAKDYEKEDAKLNRTIKTWWVNWKLQKKKN